MDTRKPCPAVDCIELAPLLKFALTPSPGEYRLAEVFAQLDRLEQLRNSFGRERAVVGFRRDQVLRARR